jgi:hypothetical protein
MSVATSLRAPSLAAEAGGEEWKRWEAEWEVLVLANYLRD